MQVLLHAHDDDGAASVLLGPLQIRGEILGLEVESQGAADNFFADSLTSGETKIDAGAPKSSKQALSRGISAIKMAKAFNGDLPWD